ncbi:MAG: hypothetical protein WD874_02065 [Parcubacteria group bacterium]
MKEEKSKVDELNESLYSRTSYTPPSDKHHSLGKGSEAEVEGKWDSPALDDMIQERRKEDRHQSPLKKFFLFSIIFVAGASLLAGYVYFGGANFVSTKNVDIQVTGPVSIPAGEPLILTVTVVNKNNAELETANLSIQYPEGTRDPADTSKALTREMVVLGSVKAGGENSQTFRSAIYGERGEIKTIRLTVQYKVEGSNATFYKDKVYEISIGDTPVAIGIAQPAGVTSGDIFSSTITIAANSTEVIRNVIIKAEYPYGFSAIDSIPEPTSGDNVWNIGDLSPGDKKKITIRGSIVGEDNEERTFRFYAGVADPENPTQLKVPLVSASQTLAIARPTVGLSLILNGQSDLEYVAPAGQSVQATLRFKNNSLEKLLNARVTVKFSGNALDKFSINPQDGGFYNSGASEITWDSNDTPALEEILPGESGQVTFRVASLATLPPGTRNPSIDLTGHISATSLGAPDVVSNVTRTVKIASEVSLSGRSLYSRGAFTNTGPIPPKVDAPTTYTVVLNLGNTQNDINESKVTMRLGANVKWAQAAQGENVTYDTNTNTVTWNVGTLASGAGSSLPGREASFQVTLTPSIGQIGSAPSLVTGITFAGTDSFTSEKTSVAISSINTRISADPTYTQGDEVVVK